MVSMRATGWIVLLCVAAVTVLMWPTALQMIERWRPLPENVLGHGWLLFPAILAGVVIEANRLQVPKYSFSPLPWAALLVIGICWAVAFGASLSAAQQLVWFLAIPLFVWATLGLGVLLRLWWPLSMFALLLPVWGLFHGLLWQVSVTAVQFLVRLLGIPAYMEGNTVELSSGTLEIASGCAGLAFFVVAISVAFLIGFFNRASLRQHLVLIAFAALMSAVCNWLRIVIIVWRAEVTKMQTSLVTEDHYTFGWLVFAVGLLAYCFWLGNYGQQKSSSAQTDSEKQMFEPAVRGVLGRVVAAVLTIGAGPALVAWAGGQAMEPVPTSVETRFAEGKIAEDDQDGWHPKFDGPNRSSLINLERRGQLVKVYEAVYWNQSQGHEMISELNSLVPDESWTTESIVTSSSHADAVVRDRAGQKWAIRYCYVIDGRCEGNPVIVQVRLGLARLVRNPATRFLAVAVHCDMSCESKNDLLTEVLRQAF